VVVQPRDDWPSFDPPEDVTVIEDVPYTLDLAPFIHDVDTPLSEMSITTSNANCSVEGLNLTMLFHEGNIDTRVVLRLHSHGGSQGGSIKVRVEENPDKPDVDDPPIVATISAIEFDEDTEFVLDLGPYIQDPDTAMEDLVISVDEPNCTVEGLALTFYFEDVEVTLDLRLTLEVSDGNSTVNRTLRLRVWDVPDVPPPPPDVWRPEVDAIPMQAFSVGAERVVDLSPFISDRDTLPGDLTLSSDQSEVLAVDGLELTVLFTEVPGATYSISFIVSDGVHEVEGSFGVVVKDADEDGPAAWYTTGAGLLSIVVIVIVVLAVTALVVWRREISR
jgi:hypothetical protein